MELNKALNQLAEIHRHLAKSEVYRGYRSFPVALTGVFALFGGALQAYALDIQSPTQFVLFWSTIAVASLLPVGVEVLIDYLQRSTPVARRLTRRVIGQLLPSITVGAVVTASITVLHPGFIPLLPGLWALLISLGIFASRPYLPRAIGWVGLFYFFAGLVLLVRDSAQPIPGPRGMAIVFGIGQNLAAVVLYWNLERKDEA
ncbi:MAG: hypothetical protein HYU36_12155 [Planctomycetes bacterium]|nr:hypothetical protein [Planctomycetota bacterium]